MSEPMAHLEHALVDVRSVDRSVEFYGKVLPGWGIRWEGSTKEGHRWIHFGPPGEGQPGYLSLYEVPGAAPPEDADALRIEHVGFAVADVEALVRRMGALGVSPSDSVDDGKYRRAYFHDPDGHLLEFVQKLEG